MDYSKIAPISEAIKADRQGAKRHYGVHPYFTRRPQNVVREHILRFTKPGDIVLDPFGGSGVTAIEALLANRTGIQNDLNPLANFIADGIANLRFLDLPRFGAAFEKVIANYEGTIAAGEEAVATRIRHSIPANVSLPKSSDVSNYHDLFTIKQLTQLALLRSEIDEVDDRESRNALLLAWSATLAKINRTFISTKGRAASRGGSSIFSIYRYKVAKDHVDLDTRDIFIERFHNIVTAKKEIDQAILLQHRGAEGFIGDYHSYSEDVLRLQDVLHEKVDYIFTDPPYGGHIAYLDLSTLWNVWLGNAVDSERQSREIIVGGARTFSEEEYISRLRKSIEASCAMLKPNRWMSVVFQHSEPKYFSAILDAAADAGAELRAAVSQVGDTVWSMHKKKNGEGVLGGEFILTFFNSGRVHKNGKSRKFDVNEWLKVSMNSGKRELYAEALLNGLILEAWNRGSLDSLSISKDELNDALKGAGFSYDPGLHCWRDSKLTHAHESQSSLF